MSSLAARLYEARRRALHDPTSLPAWGNASTEERGAWEAVQHEAIKVAIEELPPIARAPLSGNDMATVAEILQILKRPDTGPTLAECREKFDTFEGFGYAVRPVSADETRNLGRLTITADVHYTNSAVVDQVREEQRETNELGKELWTQVVRARMRSALVAIGLAAAEHSNIEDSEIDALIAAVRT